jgi:5-carboxyvanillate decarboxylase
MISAEYPLLTGGGRGYLRIATEEAFCPPDLMQRYRRVLEDRSIDDPGFYSLWSFYGGTSERARLLSERIQDLGERRIADMDVTGIDMQILSLTCPGVQMFEPEEGVALAIAANDQLAAAIAAHPDRYAGLAAIAPQNPDAAAREIERGVKTLGLRGVIINSHTRHEYLDAPKFWPIFEAAEACGVPIYLHPNTPSKQLIPAFLERGLDGAVFGFGVETGLHALRLITAGVFDRFPRLQVVLGHLGEALPFWMWRIDFMHGASVRAGRERTRKLELRPSDYLRRNFTVTTSGLVFEPAIRYAQDVLGMDRVMYAMDYPYQYVADEVRTQDNLAISLEDKRRFFQTNAERVFGLGKAR